MSVTQQEISKKQALEKTKAQIPSVEISLPSGGKVYSKEPLSNGKVSMRYMKGEDEEILISPAYFKSNKTFDVLLNRLVLEDGFDPLDLTIADKEYLVLSARIMSLGEEFNLEKGMTCTSCGFKEDDVVMKLSDVNEREIKMDPDEIGKNEFTITLPMSGNQIKIKVLTGRDQKEIEAFFNGSNPHVRDEEMITYSVAKAIVASDNLGDSFGERVRYVKEMPLKDKRYITEKLQDISGGTDFRVPHTCKRCDHVQKINIDFGLSFFL